MKEIVFKQKRGYDQMGTEEIDAQEEKKFEGWKSTFDWVMRQHIEVEHLSAFPLPARRGGGIIDGRRKTIDKERHKRRQKKETERRDRKRRQKGDRMETERRQEGGRKETERGDRKETEETERGDRKRRQKGEREKGDRKRRQKEETEKGDRKETDRFRLVFSSAWSS
ncbi:hypothetical protein, conserved [Eimeria brunetti]|uniref:Uncharacterized protein n=1 Tax=Eimeria brunetti TaxID=51314 RepID=U6LV57_9EIME|nr:hypothetical protein, conserved [Eimeria brunetti]